MPEDLRFDNRVVIVTGAGRGIGREYALLFARRGASVVVNDWGGTVHGLPGSDNPAAEVVAEIVAAGGRAFANNASVATEDGAASIVADAIARFGRIDVVVNNAGISLSRPFEIITVEEIRRLHDIHFFGTVHVTKAAWKHLTASDAGRVVNTTSTTLFGMDEKTGYGSAKGAIYAFTRNLAVEGAEVGVCVNAVAPSAVTRMTTASETTPDMLELQLATRPVSAVAGAAAYLAHQSCALSGQVLYVGGNHVSGLVLTETRGYDSPGDLSPEEIARNIDQILDTGGATAWPSIQAMIDARAAASG